MTREEAVALLERYSNYDGMGIPNLAGCKEAMRVAVDALKEAYPELAKSEDERIIKTLQEYVKNRNLPLNGPTQKEVLVWLEKQKKQMPKRERKKPKESWLEKSKYELAHEEELLIKKQKELSEIRALKNKEQKPAEWDEYTKTNLDRALQIIKKAKGTLQGYQSDDGIYECDKAIECLEHFLYRGLEIEKPAEWSDKEQTIIEGACNALEIHGHSKLAGKLKSLRPHWRPSEEQMEALRLSFEDAFDDAGDCYRYRELKSIYEQLKKLM